MKAKEFGNFLSKFALQLRELQSYKYAEFVSEASGYFQQQAPTATLAAVLKPFAKISVDPLSDGESTQYFCSALKIANITLDAFGKPAVVKDIKTVVSVFEKFSSCNLSDVLAAGEAVKSCTSTRSRSAPIRAELLEFYMGRLEETLHDPRAFMEVFRELKQNGILTVPELKKLAKMFRGATVTSKKAALDAIWARHSSLVDAKARTKASGGRSAA
jgi:hypothetical protein